MERLNRKHLRMLRSLQVDTARQQGTVEGIHCQPKKEQIAIF